MDSHILQIFLVCLEIFGLFLLLYMGTFIKTKYFKYSKGMLAFVLLGAVLKIMHWPFNNFIIIIGFLGVLVFYIMSFLKKAIKKRLDYLKLIWLLFFVLCKLSVLFHIIKRDYLVISQVIMFFVLLDYFREELQKRNQNIR